MHADQLTEIIRDITSKALGCEDIKPKDDFFDLGANSLTIVDLQVQLESKIGVTAPTSDLMISPSIQGWVGVYAAAVNAARPAKAQAAQ